MSNTSSDYPDNFKFYVLAVNEGEPPSITEFDSAQLAAESLTRLLEANKRMYGGVFYGEKWNITKGPAKYLISLDGLSRFPLFNQEESFVNDGEYLNS